MSHTIHLQAVTCALQAAYPNIPFRVSHDAIAIFIYYTANAAGAPDKEAVRKMLQARFNGVLFKIPTLINRQLH